MKVLITGGCGFIGSNLVEFILEKTNWNMVVLDNLTHGKIEDIENLSGWQERGEFVKGDIRNKEDVLKAIQGCDYVVNLAAQTGVIESVEDPLDDADHNVNGLITVLLAARDSKVKKLVQASSAAPLGEQEVPIDETKVPKPLSPYGASKLAGEGLCSAFSGSFGLNTVVLRFSNVYGPKSYAKGSVIPKFIKQILNGEQVTVYGDGEQTRDFIYVKDICNAIYLSLITDLENKFELFQIATNTETSVNKMFAVLKQELGKHSISVANPNYEPARPGEIIRNYCAIDKAKKIIKYTPLTEFEEGVRNTVEWFMKR